MNKFHAFSNLKSFLRLFMAILFGACLCTTIHAQFSAFSSTPTYSVTFDSAPTSNLGFEWQAGRSPNTGLAYFNGISHYTSLASLTDALGRSFPQIGGTYTLEFWVAFESWASMSHFFDVSNGSLKNNIFLGNLDTGNGIRFGTIIPLDANASLSQERLIDRTGILSAGVFSHVAVTTTLISPQDTTSAAATLVSLYVNGRLIGNTTQYAMPIVARTTQYLAKSSWSTDGLFNGWVDTFNYYNYGLSDQAVFAHAVLQRAPAFELTFGQDPTVIAGTSATYRFVLSDSTDVANNVSQWHQGVVTLDGSSQYVDLSTASGTSTVGTTLPTFGGAGYGTGSNGYAQGWSFEVTFRVSSVNSNSKIFDFSSSGSDRVYLGFQSGSTLYFNVQRGSATSTSTSVIPNVATNTWYHVVIVVTPISLTAGTADHRVYVNGVSVVNATGSYPNAVARGTAYIGRSYTSTDSYCALTFDLLRIHDYGLTERQARLLYYTVSQVAPVDPIPAPTIPSTAPRHVINFDAAQQQTGYSSYDFINNTNDGHFGVAAFNGVNSSVNLLYYPDSRGEYFTPVFGGTSMSFAFWAKWLDVPSYARIFDFAGALGQNDNNIIFGTYSASTQIFFRVYSGSSSTTCYAPGSIRPGNWQHVVAVVAANTSSTSATTAANLMVYIDGKLFAQNPGYIPPRVYRSNLLIARSNWVADARFRGYIDSFEFYEYDLDPQQIASFACTTRPPVFDFSFTRDPRTLNTSVTYNYGWQNEDPEILLPNTMINPTNQSVTFVHKGMLAFNGNGQYVNLTATSGPTNIGVQLPIIGGAGSGIDQYVGWTFEISFKLNAYSTWAKIFDWGVENNGDDDILLGLVDNTHQLGFEILNSRVRNSNGGPSSARAILVREAPLNTWYHIVVIVTPLNLSAATATWTPYVNGEVIDAVTGIWPDNIRRKNANVGKSNWNDAYFNGLVDSIRVYDYAVSEDSVRCLYRASRSAPTAVSEAPLFNPGPQNSYSFESGYDPAQSSVASFRWVAEMDGRSGIAAFDGVNHYINLLGYTDGRQRSFPNIMGGTDLTFSAWVRFNSFAQYSRIFDIGNGAAVQNLALMNVAQTSNLGFHVYSSYGSSAHNTELTWPQNRWVHVVVTVSRNSQVTDISATNAAVYSIYFNGTLVNTLSGVYTTRAERLKAYLGRSGWSADAYFNGAMDTFSWYDYALPYESIQIHSQLSRPPYIELTFTTDPRSPNISSNFLYNWINRDSADPADSKHQGILDLDGPASYYVDLMRTRGNHSIGIAMPSIGGVSSGTASTGTLGWSFEVVFKFDSITNFCKIFNMGNGENPSGELFGDDNVIFGLRGTSNLFTFEIMNSRTRAQTVFNLQNVTLGRWYSAIVVVEPTDVANFRARYTGYMDGNIVSVVNNAVYLQGIYRENAYLGKSEWSADALCDAKVDVLRIYDYALSQSEVSMLVSRTMDPFVPATSSSTGSVVPATSSSTATSPASSTGSSSASKGCSYNGPVPTGSISATLIFRGKPVSEIPSTFGSAFAETLREALASTNQIAACTGLYDSTGRVYNAAPLSALDTKVQFYLLNTYGNAEELYSLLAQKVAEASSTASTSLTSILNRHAGSYYTIDTSSLERVDPSPSSGDDKLNSGAIAGIVIGVIVGVIILICLALYFIRGRSGKSYSYEDKHAASHKYDTQHDEGTDHGDETHSETDDTHEVEMEQV